MQSGDAPGADAAHAAQAPRRRAVENRAAAAERKDKGPHKAKIDTFDDDEKPHVPKVQAVDD